jgi:glycosyltransferase involved in cell wall biosynthesis
MRIAFLSVSDHLGGSEAMLLQIAMQLKRSRPTWEQHLILPGDGPLAPLACAAGMSTIALPMPASLARLGEWGLRSGSRGQAGVRLVRAALDLPSYERRMRQALESISPDIVHSNGFKAHVVSARTHDPARALVWHVHEYVAARPVTRSLLRRYADRCAAIVTNSRSVADDVRGVVTTNADIRTIYNAVDLERFAPEGCSLDLDGLAGLAAPSSPPVRVGLVATYSRWKGHDVFLRALAKIPRGRNIRGYVIGGAVYDTDRSQYSLDELRTLARTIGVDDRVGFTGFVAASERAMRALDIVVHASTTPEPFGLVIAEAMACGRAVVTSSAGGSAELVRDGHDAVTHNPGDADALAAVIERLASDAARRARLGAAARQTALQRFDARRLGDEFAAVYETAREGAAAHR